MFIEILESWCSFILIKDARVGELMCCIDRLSWKGTLSTTWDWRLVVKLHVKGIYDSRQASFHIQLLKIHSSTVPVEVNSATNFSVLYKSFTKASLRSVLSKQEGMLSG